MERLTSRTSAGVANLNYSQSCFYPDGTKDQVAVSAYRQKAIDRLAAYEDTGLEPEEIAALSQAEKDGRLVVLPSNDPLTLEELREMDGEPVWIVPYGKFENPGYALINAKEEFLCTSYPHFWSFEAYGKNFIAYRRKPEKGEENA